MTIASASPSAQGARTDAQAAFVERLTTVAKETDRLLDCLLSAQPAAGETARPSRLLDAMRYVSLGAANASVRFWWRNRRAVRRAAAGRADGGAALECVHCYSLVHDDLPAMDNDDLRRGQPTAHKEFDEATAILAGDGLLTFAFDILSRAETHPTPPSASSWSRRWRALPGWGAW